MGKCNWKDKRTLDTLVGEEKERKRPVSKKQTGKSKKK